MQDLIQKIEQWAEDRNIIKGSKPIDQAMKLFSEFGELADNVAKGCCIKDDIGDVFVVLTIMAKQTNLSMFDALNFSGIGVGSLKHGVAGLSWCLSDFVNDPRKLSLMEALEALDAICYEAKVKLEECVQIAYNDIKDRTGVMYNGVFIKSTDAAYQDAIDNIEADKRIATQKRISVDIQDI